MTFTFDAFSGLLFFLSFGALFLICGNAMSNATTPRRTDCALHPNTDECAHRKPRKE